MLFGRKKEAAKASQTRTPQRRTASERRRQYRRKNSPSSDLRIHMHVGQILHQGVVVDLSMFGCGVAFVREQNPRLSLGDVAEVTITSLQHGRVCTPARIVWARTTNDGGFRYGLEFISMGSLYAQMNSFYARLFNRRRAPRVKPPLDTRVACRLHWGGKELAGAVRELSATGASLDLTREAARGLVRGESIALRFKLSRGGPEISGLAEIKNRTEISEHVLLGVDFDHKQEGGFAAHLATIEQYVDERLAEVDRWEENWSKLA
jgi:c-di-GMP-binding flagellar brake protein YcgR